MDEFFSLVVKVCEIWVGKFDFIFVLIGFFVGFGNIWCFLYLCYKNGGGEYVFINLCDVFYNISV